MNAAREQALPLCREAIRHAANAIRAIHRLDAARARALVAQSGERVAAAAALLAAYPEVLHAGFVHDAQKEYAEASLTIALILEEPLPSAAALAVGQAAYLNGMGEAVGELRRHLLDSLRGGDIVHCERLLALMDDLYSLLVTIDFPDALTGGLRRTTDVTRGILEKSRGDLTVAAGQYRLEERLATLTEWLARAEPGLASPEPSGHAGR